jgi:hypothetical protein
MSNSGLQQREIASPQRAKVPTSRRTFSVALTERLIREIDPDGILPPDERDERLQAARSEYFTRLGSHSIEARRAAALVNHVRAVDLPGLVDKLAAAEAANAAAHRANRALVDAFTRITRDWT